MVANATNAARLSLSIIVTGGAAAGAAAVLVLTPTDAVVATAGIGVVALLATASALGRWFARAGVPRRDQPARAVQLAGVATAALVFALVGGTLNDTDADTAQVTAAARVAGANEDAGQSAGGGGNGAGSSGDARGSETADGDDSSEGADSDVRSESASSDADADGNDPASGSGPGGSRGSNGSTPTTQPKGGSAGDSACKALDDYEGDADALLDLLDIDADEITDAACAEIEGYLDALEDLLGDLTPGVTVPSVPGVPVPTTVPSLPGVTVPGLPVPTTLPPVTVPGLF